MSSESSHLPDAVGSPLSGRSVPALSADQMREVDRAMIEDYGIELIQMMENAGRNLAHLARARFLGGDPRGKRVVVLCGTGGNGGGGLVCARRLHNWGADVSVLTTRDDDAFAGVLAHQLRIARKMGIPVESAVGSSRWPDCDLLIDALIGYSLSGPPNGAAAVLIAQANAGETPVLSLDTPSGIDVSSGSIPGTAVRATATLTLALPKAGLVLPEMVSYVGELYVADISVPPGLYAGEGLGLAVDPIFALADIVRLA